MANDAAVTLVGSLTRDPELRYTTGGRGVASAGIAVNRRWQSSGEWQEEVSFFNLTAWAELGENMAQSLTKGTRVICTGRLSQRSYENRDGQKVNIVEVVVDAIGPDLRWANAVVERVERDRPSERAGSSGNTGSDPVYGEEEPFLVPADEVSL